LRGIILAMPIRGKCNGTSPTYARTGDPATGEFGDANVIRKFGDVPDHLNEVSVVTRRLAKEREYERRRSQQGEAASPANGAGSRLSSGSENL
jgi:hypothetical protein